MVLAWAKDSGKVAFCGMCGSFCCRGLRKRGNIECFALNSLFLGTNTGGSTEEGGKRERETPLFLMIKQLITANALSRPTHATALKAQHFPVI